MRETTSGRGAWVLAALERHEKPLIAYTARLLGDADRARDVVQEAFLRLCRQDRATVEPHLAEWLYTVCRNRARDLIRKDRPMQDIDDTALAGRAELDPPAAAERADTLSEVLREVGGLPESQREVLRLKFQNGLSYKEIAKVTDKTVGNVGFLLHVALKTLRQKLAVEPLRESMEGSSS